ncbi:uncharacterized protein BDW43DRAFT_275468 [Aspergillus alliaceus]|uniref:uncharacterized protein n=1 Tax=Petromyces alliaceus TaxID=209559 RepID=UPI0012A5F2CB|nr:uncharacterized protein BDW43DRAFT_275468 [Aspergillus alliaceus]KAB8233901.1 hypothetical protein BDW43DRAFT_275468 [Aspergillus alliaceus]
MLSSIHGSSSPSDLLYTKTQIILITIMAATQPRVPIIPFSPARLPSHNNILPGRTFSPEKLDPKHAKELFTEILLGH